MDVPFKEAVLFAENFVSHIMNKLVFHSTPYRNVNVFPRGEGYRRSSVYNGFSDNVREAVDLLSNSLSCSIESRFNDIVEGGDLSRYSLLQYSKDLWERYLSDGVEVIVFLRFCVMMTVLGVHFYRRGLTWAPDLVFQIITERLPIMGPSRIPWDTFQMFADRFVEESVTRQSPRATLEAIPSTSGETTSGADSSSCACFEKEIIRGTFLETYEERNRVLYNHKVYCCGGGVNIERFDSFNRTPNRIKRYSSHREIDSNNNSEHEDYLKFTSTMIETIMREFNDGGVIESSSSLDGNVDDSSNEIQESGRKLSVSEKTESCQPSDPNNTWSRKKILQWLEKSIKEDFSESSMACDVEAIEYDTSLARTDEFPANSRSSSIDFDQNIHDTEDGEQQSNMSLSVKSTSYPSVSEEDVRTRTGLISLFNLYAKTREHMWLIEIKKFFANYESHLHVDLCPNEPLSDLQFPDMTDFLNMIVMYNSPPTTSTEWNFQLLRNESDVTTLRRSQSHMPVLETRQIERPLKIHADGGKSDVVKKTEDSDNVSSAEVVNSNVLSYSKRLELSLEKQSRGNLSESLGNVTHGEGSSSSSQNASDIPTDSVETTYLHSRLKRRKASSLTECMSDVVDVKKELEDTKNTPSGEAPSRNQSLPSRSDQMNEFPLGRRSEILSSESSGNMELCSGSSSASYHNLPEYSALSEAAVSEGVLDRENSDPLAVFSDIEDGHPSSENSGEYPELQWSNSSSECEPTPDLGK